MARFASLLKTLYYRLYPVKSKTSAECETLLRAADISSDHATTSRLTPPSSCPPIAAIVVLLWLSFPLVAMCAKCFLTEKCVFSVKGSNFCHPLSAATLHLLLV